MGIDWPWPAAVSMLSRGGRRPSCISARPGRGFVEGELRVRILVTGGAGFIGSAVCRHLIRDTEHAVVNLDKLTYSANLASLADIEASPRYSFVQADICDGRRMLAAMEEH